MTDDEILAHIRRALVDVVPERADEFNKVILDTEVASLELDSISIMEMIAVVEDELDITLPDDQLSSIEHFADLGRLVRAALDG
jgi:acyl carrier protein